jgi:hypothetical protein
MRVALLGGGGWTGDGGFGFMEQPSDWPRNGGEMLSPCYPPAPHIHCPACGRICALHFNQTTSVARKPLSQLLLRRYQKNAKKMIRCVDGRLPNRYSSLASKGLRQDLRTEMMNDEATMSAELDGLGAVTIWLAATESRREAAFLLSGGMRK